MHAPFLSVTPHPRSAPHSRSFVKSLDRSVFLCALSTRSCRVHQPAPEELSQGRGPQHDGLCGGEEGHQDVRTVFIMYLTIKQLTVHLYVMAFEFQLTHERLTSLPVSFGR